MYSIYTVYNRIHVAVLTLNMLRIFIGLKALCTSKYSLYRNIHKDNGDTLRFEDDHVVKSVSKPAPRRIYELLGLNSDKPLLRNSIHVYEMKFDKATSLMNIKMKPVCHERLPYSEMELRKCIVHVLRALEDLHAQNYCHRDVRWPNIVYDAGSDSWKLIDFEIAAENRAFLPDSICSEHVPPENRIKKSSSEYTTKGDVYAVGKLVTEFMRQHKMEIVPGKMADFVSVSMKDSPSTRPSVTNLLKHPWLAVDETTTTTTTRKRKK